MDNKIKRFYSLLILVSHFKANYMFSVYMPDELGYATSIKRIIGQEVYMIYEYPKTS